VRGTPFPLCGHGGTDSLGNPVVAGTVLQDGTPDLNMRSFFPPPVRSGVPVTAARAVSSRADHDAATRVPDA
jgi:hypothetical protein